LKIVILILSSNTYPSKRNKKAIQKTWANKNYPNTDIYFYSAGTKTKIVGRDLIVKDSGTAQDIGKKTLSAFDWVDKNLEYDFIFRTNTSSYVEVNNLVKYVENIPQNMDYTYKGVVQEREYENVSKNYKFVSGAGIILDKSTVKAILHSQNLWDHSEWDDIALGKLLSSLNIKPQTGKRDEIKGNFYNSDIDITNYHVRCRLDQVARYPRFLEALVIKDLHKIYHREKPFAKNLKKYMFYVFKIFYIQKPFWRIYNYVFKMLKFILPQSIYKILKNFKSKKLYKFVLKYNQEENKES